MIVGKERAVEQPNLPFHLTEGRKPVEVEGKPYYRLRTFDVSVPEHQEFIRGLKGLRLGIKFAPGLTELGTKTSPVLWTVYVPEANLEAYREYDLKNYTKYLYPQNHQWNLEEGKVIWIEKPRKEDAPVIGISLEGKPLQIPEGEFYKKIATCSPSEVEKIRQIARSLPTPPIFEETDREWSWDRETGKRIIHQAVFIPEGQEEAFAQAIEDYFYKEVAQDEGDLTSLKNYIEKAKELMLANDQFKELRFGSSKEEWQAKEKLEKELFWHLRPEKAAKAVFSTAQSLVEEQKETRTGLTWNVDNLLLPNPKDTAIPLPLKMLLTTIPSFVEETPRTSTNISTVHARSELLKSTYRRTKPKIEDTITITFSLGSEASFKLVTKRWTVMPEVGLLPVEAAYSCSLESSFLPPSKGTSWNAKMASKEFEDFASYAKEGIDFDTKPLGDEKFLRNLSLVDCLLSSIPTPLKES